MNSTSMPDYFAFKVRTNFTGGMVHLSPFASITVAQLFKFTQSSQQNENLDKANSANEYISTTYMSLPDINSYIKSSSTQQFTEKEEVLPDELSALDFLTPNEEFNKRLTIEKGSLEIHSAIQSELDLQKSSSLNQSANIFEQMKSDKKGIYDDYGGKVVGSVVVGGLISAVGYALVKFVANSFAKQSVDAEIIKRMRSKVAEKSMDATNSIQKLHGDFDSVIFEQEQFQIND